MRPALLALFALAGLLDPKPRVGLTVIAASDSTVTMSATVTLRSGALRPGDKIRYNWFQGPTLVVSKDTAALTLAQVFKAPCGTSGTVSVAVKVVGFDGTVDARTVKGALPYTQPACPVPPPPVIDTVQMQLLPASAALSPGQAFPFSIPS